MKKTAYLLLAIMFCFIVSATAQVSSPVSVNLSIGGGASIPSGDFSNAWKTGYHGAAKLRIGSILPLDITGNAAYHHFSDSSGNGTLNIVGIAAGFEYPIPSVEIKPYLSAEVAMNMLSDNAPNSSSKSRIGVNVGVGAQFMGFDGSVKYEILNMSGKETVNNIEEKTYNQIVVTLSYVFGL